MKLVLVSGAYGLQGPAVNIDDQPVKDVGEIHWSRNGVVVVSTSGNVIAQDGQPPVGAPTQSSEQGKPGKGLAGLFRSALVDEDPRREAVSALFAREEDRG